jgi:hypothetical protein
MSHEMQRVTRLLPSTDSYQSTSADNDYSIILTNQLSTDYDYPITSAWICLTHTRFLLLILVDCKSVSVHHKCCSGSLCGFVHQLVVDHFRKFKIEVPEMARMFVASG